MSTRTTSVVMPISYESAIKAGNSQYGNITLEIDPSELTQLQRETLLTRPKEDCLPSIVRWAHEESLLPPLGAATMPELKRALDHFATLNAQLEAKEKTDYEKQIAKILELGLEGLVEDRRGFNFLEKFRDDPRVSGLIDEVIARRNQLDAQKREAENVAREAAQKAQEAERERKIAALKTWAHEHGSGRLLTMLEMNVGDWQTIARQEYFAFAAPEYAGKRFSAHTYQSSGRDRPRERPTLEELDALKQVRRLCEKRDDLSEAELRWCTVDATHNDDGDEETPEQKYCIITVAITAPDGAREVAAIKL